MSYPKDSISSHKVNVSLSQGPRLSSGSGPKYDEFARLRHPVMACPPNHLARWCAAPSAPEPSPFDAALSKAASAYETFVAHCNSPNPPYFYANMSQFFNYNNVFVMEFLLAFDAIPSHVNLMLMPITTPRMVALAHVIGTKGTLLEPITGLKRGGDREQLPMPGDLIVWESNYVEVVAEYHVDDDRLTTRCVHPDGKSAAVQSRCYSGEDWRRQLAIVVRKPAAGPVAIAPSAISTINAILRSAHTQPDVAVRPPEYTATVFVGDDDWAFSACTAVDPTMPIISFGAETMENVAYMFVTNWNASMGPIGLVMTPDQWLHVCASTPTNRPARVFYQLPTHNTGKASA